MNFLSKISKVALMAVLALGAVACSQSGNNGKAPAKAGQSATGAKSEQAMVIRYVDEDTIMAQYNLSKDFKETLTRMQSQYDAAQKSRQQSLQNFENECNAKAKNNTYAANPQQYQADQQKYQKMMADAQDYLSGQQQRMENTLRQNNKELQDSITNYLKDYAKQKGYDMILMKSATLFVDPSYDVTADVVKGLNKRYTKVAAPKK